ncbi:hypothetical protein ABW20_dc0105691 [Dactylellina cionopaga]|nr:hypothetical protein ABW20_dc0105691 [Dactylellina cionopaga]
MADQQPSDDLSSLGFTSFGKTSKSHSSMPIHANPTSLPQSLPPKPSVPAQFPPPNQYHHQQQQQQQHQQYSHRPRGGGNRGNRGGFDGRGRGGPHRSRGFHSNRGGRGGRGGGHHHHPYSHPDDQQGQQQQRPFNTNQTPTYRSKIFGEGFYKPSMVEDPWRELSGKTGTGENTYNAATVAAATSGVGDVWLGENSPVDKSNWHDKEEDKAPDGGGWNADEIDLDDI